MVRTKDIYTTLLTHLGRGRQWWGGVGCRVAFYMSVALFLVAVAVGAFFYWQGRAALQNELKGRMLYIARTIATLTAGDLRSQRRDAVRTTIRSALLSYDGSQTDQGLVFLALYSSTGNLLAAATRDSLSPLDDPPVPEGFPGNSGGQGKAALGSDTLRLRTASFRTAAGMYEIVLPVVIDGNLSGFVRVGMSGEGHGERFRDLARHGAIAFLLILVLGLAFSQVIAVSITRPIHRLSDAVEDLSRQNWKAPIPVQGNDEISRLGHAFNRMALTLRQRDASLSRANRDLFILHTAGLDLMESLELETLLPAIAARATDLVQADTTALAVVNRTERNLKYLGVFGSKAEALQGLDPPLEAGGIYNWIVSYGSPLLILDAQSDFRLDRDRMASLGIRSIMAVPLWSASALTGLLTAVNKRGGGAFDKHDFRLFTVFANLIGAALQNASLYGDLKGSMGKLEDAQEKLIHSTKMAAIGELAANVAHEINNPLTSVLGYTTHLLKTLDLPEEPKKLLLIMQQETLRVRRIIRNLLDFARQRPAWMQPADIRDSLRETVALIQGVAEASAVRVHQEYDVRPIIVNMDVNEIKQVFINIVTNALQSMPKGGLLTIRAAVDRDTDAVIEFADTGTGISAENRAKIFEPFFSTKGERDGTGLGLSISYRIVRNHGGRIEVESEEGRGSLFRVRLPLYRPSTSGATRGRESNALA